MKNLMPGFIPSDDIRSRVLSLLILPIAAGLFGYISGFFGEIFSMSMSSLNKASQQPDIFLLSLLALVLACLLALLIFHLLNVLRLFRGKATLVFAAALIFSPLAVPFSHSQTTVFVSWLAEFIFLLFASQTTLQLSLMPPNIRYKSSSFRSLAFLLLIGCLAAIYQADRSVSSIVTAYVVLVCMFITLHILSLQKQRNIQLMQIALDDSAMVGNLRLTLSPESIRQLLPYFRYQMNEGSPVAKLLILELIRGTELDGKEDLAKAAFRSGSLEVQIAVIDQIFSWSLPYQLLVYAVENCSDSLAEYLVRKIFVNYPDLTNHGMFEELQKRVDYIRNYSLGEETQKMFAYVFDGRREAYACILNTLLRSDRKEDRIFAAEIMASYIGYEDEINRKYLTDVIENSFFNPAELEEMIELCAEYDRDLGYLRNYLSNYYNYDFLKKICDYYEPVSITKTFSNSDYPLPIALTILAACRLDKNGMGMYRGKIHQLNEYIIRMGQEESRILAAGFCHEKLLLDEMKSLKLTLMAIVLEYMHLEEMGVLPENAFEDIKQGRKMLFSDELKSAGKTHQAMLIKDALVEGEVDYRPLRVSENNPLLESMYRYLRGETMEPKLTENIEKLISLKSIPMFGDLDIFTLQQIQKISVYKKVSVEWY